MRAGVRVLLETTASVMNAVIYARYSSNRQREESIEDQLKVCSGYAQREGYTVIEEYCDYALSGTTDARPEFQKMVAAASKGTFQAVIVYKLDRFARNRRDASVYRHKLKSHGVRIISASEAIPETPDGIIMESLMEGMAEWYSANLSQNVKRGLMGNAEKCKANGVYIFGYLVNADGYYEPDPVNSEIVEEIFKRYARGESQAAIASWLNESGVKTLRGTKWTNTKVSWVIKNDKYTGLYHFSDYYKEGGMPTLVSKELWFEANNRAVRGKAMTAETPLSGKVYCGKCGKRMVGTSGTSRDGTIHYYYTCPELLKKKCPTKRIPHKKLDDFVILKTLELLDDEQAIDEIADSMERYIEEKKENKLVEGLREKRNNINQRINNIRQTLEIGGHDQTLRDRLSELEEEKVLAEKELRSEERKLNLPHDELFRFWLGYVHDTANENDVSAHKMLDAFVSFVEVSDDYILIEYNYRELGSDMLAQYRHSVRKLIEWSG